MFVKITPFQIFCKLFDCFWNASSSFQNSNTTFSWCSIGFISFYDRIQNFHCLIIPRKNELIEHQDKHIFTYLIYIITFLMLLNA
ncbi:hypothetical protein ALC57_10463 [Trachymyrmex cornetzi]|uniref:Uncharacterized protein n=1 Tax=Trachymyrmex cornetzi TaxID=471704 RepID=A0A195DWH7_9HYME|nr:hypothetical protein ALC57_10463 [Trachymyrmex cornetzi]